MKYRIQLLGAVLILWNIQASGGGVSPQVVNSAGNSLKSGYTIVDYSVGEIMITTLTSGTNRVTQGFLQPTKSQMVTGMASPSDQNKVALFPNPTLGHMSFRISAEVVQLNVYGIDGVKHLSIEQPNGEIELSNLNKGVYYVELIGKDNLKLTYSKIIKTII